MDVMLHGLVLAMVVGLGVHGFSRLVDLVVESDAWLRFREQYPPQESCPRCGRPGSYEVACEACTPL